MEPAVHSLNPSFRAGGHPAKVCTYGRPKYQHGKICPAAGAGGGSTLSLLPALLRTPRVDFHRQGVKQRAKLHAAVVSSARQCDTGLQLGPCLLLLQA